MGMTLIEGNVLAQALYRLATHPSPGGLPPAPWEGTAAQLIIALRGICHDAGMPAAELPDDPRVAGRQVREIAPALRKAGVDVRTRKSGPRRLLRVTKTGSQPGQP